MATDHVHNVTAVFQHPIFNAHAQQWKESFRSISLFSLIEPEGGAGPR